jgi:hypothetical protein
MPLQRPMSLIIPTIVGKTTLSNAYRMSEPPEGRNYFQEFSMRAASWKFSADLCHLLTPSESYPA